MAFPIGLALTAAPMIYRAISGRGGGSSSGASPYSRRFDTMTADTERRGREAEDEYLAYLRGADPEAEYGASLKAELDEYDEDFAKTYADNLGAMVGRGRSPTRSGFGLRDANFLVEQGQADRNRLRERNRAALFDTRTGIADRIGSYGVGKSGQAYEAVTGRMNTLEAQKLADAASRRQMWGGLIGGALSAAGSYAGNRSAAGNRAYVRG